MGLGVVEKIVIIFSGLGFIIMFAIGSATGGYNDLIKTTLENDELRRKNKRK
ncbi:hypothetical protein EV11_1207 [Prochlorococcus sp. SS52]|nr:hypothetical protein EV04_0520 [Prochlorococcus marinus str. LG]KGG19167.1 hypothetical protein EV08_1654 [Prochlorococcus marinus str. SS2]KGG23292.1 hypothetical protein EV09_0916 [Prochlorococcus marinus str. SS35]KGG32473.1 hypothetical protein EV10_1588 [Prochlorococcus marinus str. SS51]KGG35643.1 hypothetical protein EV11_1207 [Prochlorococcus sp. SS52]